MTRYSELHPETMTPDQRRVYEAIKSGPRGEVGIPHLLLLRNAEIADHAQQLGATLRYQTGLPALLSESAILAVARHWNNGFEWSHHLPIARKAGLSQGDEVAIASGERPSEPEVAMVVEFCRELLKSGTLRQDTFSDAVETFGERRVVELICLVGYYSMLAMLMNAFDVPGNTASWA